MKKQSVNRAYNFPDADLYDQSVERLRHARRDLKYFQTYAYGEDKLQAFEDLCRRFVETPTDEELTGEQMVATEKKNEKAEQLKTAIRSVMTRVANKYSIRSGRYRKFGTYKMNDMSDPKLLLCGRRVVRVASQQLPLLRITGLQEQHIEEVRDAAKQFENALHIKQDKTADRDIAVEKRIELGNQVYEELVNICNIGKDIWAEKNKAKYEGYTIYESNNDQKKARKARIKAEQEQQQNDKTF